MQEEVDQKVISLCVTGMRMSKDVDVITAAFQEYAGVTLKKKEKRASVHKKLENAKMVVKNRARKEKQRIRQKIKHREQSR